MPEEVDPRIAHAKQIIARKFREAREGAGMSQNRLAALAKDLGIPGERTTIIDIEQGRANPTIEYLAGLLSLCGVDFDDFLTGMNVSGEPLAHQRFHRLLADILRSGKKELIQAIGVNLEAIAEKAGRLKMRRPREPTPDPGEDGRDEAVSQQAKRKRAKARTT
jgi:transcriptional regulator with XRE-family HTH domain